MFSGKGYDLSDIAAVTRNGSGDGMWGDGAWCDTRVCAEEYHAPLLRHCFSLCGGCYVSIGDHRAYYPLA